MDPPSDIDVTEESVQGEYDSHESLGFMKRERSEVEIQYEESHVSLPSKLYRTENELNPEESSEVKPRIIDDREADRSADHTDGPSIEPSELPRFAERGTNGIFVDENSHSFTGNAVGDQSIYDGKIHAEATIEDTDNNPKSETSRILDFAANQPQYMQTSSKVKFEYLPPLHIPPEKFVAHTMRFRSASQRYIQVLIWCLRRRIERASYSNRMTTEICNKVLTNMQYGLADGQIKLKFYTGTPGPLKPTVANPQNEQVRTIINELAGFNRKLSDEEQQAKLKMPVIKHDGKFVQPALGFVDDSQDLEARYAQVLMRAQSRIREWADMDKNNNTNLKEVWRDHEDENKAFLRTL